MSTAFNFKILSKGNPPVFDPEELRPEWAGGSKARAGELVTPHGIIETPQLIVVGTQGTVKSLTPKDLEEIGVEIVMGNTYHLYLRPGEDTVSKFGGLGKFCGNKEKLANPIMFVV